MGLTAEQKLEIIYAKDRKLYAILEDLIDYIFTLLDNNFHKNKHKK